MSRWECRAVCSKNEEEIKGPADIFFIIHLSFAPLRLCGIKKLRLSEQKKLDI